MFKTKRAGRLLAGAFLLLGSPGNAEEAAKHILILHSYNYTFPATSMASDGARKRLLERSPQKIELDAEYLDLARFAEPGHETLMANFLRDRFANRQPDIVMVIGGEALPFVTKHRDDFAPRVPVIFLGVSRQGYAAAKPPSDVTGHVVDLDLNLDKTIALAERLQPEASHLFVVAGSGFIDRRWQSIARGVVEARERKLETTYLFDFPYDELITKVSQLPKDSIFILLSVFRDGNGSSRYPSGAREINDLAGHFQSCLRLVICGCHDTRQTDDARQDTHAAEHAQADRALQPHRQGR